MILVALAVVILGTYVPLMLHASAGRRGAAFLGALEGALLVAGAGFASLLAAYLAVAKCDESCDENISPEVRRGEWWHTLDAWQWKVQLALAVTALLAALATVGLPLLRRHTAAIVAVVLGLAVFCAWALMISPLGDQFGI